MRMLACSHFKECQDELIGIRRLAFLMTRRSDFTQHNFAMTISSEVFEPESQLISSALKPSQFQRYTKLLNGIAPHSSRSLTTGTHSRLETLSAVQFAHLEDPGSFDIDIALQMVNEYYDHLYAVLAATDDGTSAKWLDDWFDRTYSTDRNKPKAQIVYGGRKTRARGIGTTVISETAPATGHLRETVADACVRKTMNQTGIAVQLFRAENKRFPSQLAELFPEYLPEIPQDEFANGQTLTYTKPENSCYLLSVGADEIPDTDDDIRLEFNM